MIAYENGIPREMTEEEIKKYRFELRPEEEIEMLRQILVDTNYVIIDMAEGLATPEECADIIEQRKEWRKRINELEEQIEKGEKK